MKSILRHIVITALFSILIAVSSQAVIAASGAAITFASATSINILELKVSQPRLYDSNPLRVIEGLNPELSGFQFTSIPQRIEISYELRVVKSGSMFVMFGGNDAKPIPKDRIFFDHDASRWKRVDGAIKGKNIIACFQSDVRAGETLFLKAFELQIVAGSIVPQGSVTSAKQSTPSIPGTIQTDSNQPRIEVLKDQGPNAIEWALAPLEQVVPGDIRQNITFLREDLLTETQDKPKLSATRDAGAKLCDAIIGVLDERKLTLAKAGFRAVEAGARTGVTSQALEARRNYKMSWPQFAREESQRAELKSQALGNAQVMAERPKLDWAQRTAALQKPLDDLYRQYCEALRQPAK